MRKTSNQVILSNTGSVYAGISGRQADKVFREYANLSSVGKGKAGGQTVTWIQDGEIHREFQPIPVLVASPAHAFYIVVGINYDKYAKKLAKCKDIRLYSVQMKDANDRIGLIVGAKSLEEARLAVFDILHYTRISKCPRPVVGS